MFLCALGSSVVKPGLKTQNNTTTGGAQRGSLTSRRHTAGTGLHTGLPDPKSTLSHGHAVSSSLCIFSPCHGKICYLGPRRECPEDGQAPAFCPEEPAPGKRLRAGSMLGSSWPCACSLSPSSLLGVGTRRGSHEDRRQAAGGWALPSWPHGCPQVWRSEAHSPGRPPSLQHEAGGGRDAPHTIRRQRRRGRGRFGHPGQPPHSPSRPCLAPRASSPVSGSDSCYGNRTGKEGSGKGGHMPLGSRPQQGGE